MKNKEFFISHWNKEMKRTLGAIKGLPSDIGKWEFKPDPKSRTAKQIIGHILPHAEELKNAVDSKIIDEKEVHFKSVDEAHKYYETHSLQLIDKLTNVDDETWENEMVSLTVNGNKIYEGKMMDMYWVLLHDTIHHRGQLSTYYRQMGVRVPSIYGPTAEDMEAMMAAAAAAAK